MKKIFLVLVSVFALFASGCKQATDDSISGPSIRYQNVMSDNGSAFNLNYGVKLGSAVYDGALPAGNVTDYIVGDAGEYSVQFKSNTGVWITVSDRSLSVPSGTGKYTLNMSGDWTANTVKFQLIKDE